MVYQVYLVEALISPLGYDYDKQKKVHVLDQKTEAMCRFIFDEFDNNDYSLDRFVGILNQKGFASSKGKPWRKGQLHYMLTNPFYHGEFFYNGAVWPGNHEPYYPFSRYQKRLLRLENGFIGKKKRIFDFKLSGLLRCNCGRAMTGDFEKGTYIYYKHVCPNSEKQIYVRESELFSGLDREIARARFSEHFSKSLKSLFRNYAYTKGGEVKSDIDRLHGKIALLESKKDKLLGLFIDDGIDKQLLKRKLDDINGEISTLRNHEKSLSISHDRLILKICEVIDDIRDKPLVYLNAGENEKAGILNSMARGVIINGETLEIQWQKPYSLLIKPAILSIKQEVENQHHLQNKKDEFKSSNSSESAPPVGPLSNELQQVIEDTFFEFRLWYSAA